LRGVQDRGAFASPGESDSLALVAGALPGFSKSSISSISIAVIEVRATPGTR
jgi:hypothetical protein